MSSHVEEEIPGCGPNSAFASESQHTHDAYLIVVSMRKSPQMNEYLTNHLTKGSKYSPLHHACCSSVDYRFSRLLQRQCWKGRM